jgi:hypothetical protein
LVGDIEAVELPFSEVVDLVINEDGIAEEGYPREVAQFDLEIVFSLYDATSLTEFEVNEIDLVGCEDEDSLSVVIL